MSEFLKRFNLSSDYIYAALLVLFIWLVCFIEPIMGRVYTAWDTHDLGFVNFLYFSDSLRDGYIPFWNHFIQSGTYFSSFFNVGIYSPFQLFFVGLSWFINPVYVYELMLHFTVMVGGFGVYLLLSAFSKEKLVALFCATAFAVTVLVPITGQVMFLFSLSSLPWLVYASIKIIKSKRNNYSLYVLWGVLGAMYISSGYIWMNLVNVLVVLLFVICASFNLYTKGSFKEKEILKLNLIKLGVFFFTFGFLYACLVLPGYINLNSLYSIFSGDYINPEPRLRSLGAQPHYAYSSFLHALVASINPSIAINNDPFFDSIPKWSFGAGWVLWIIAFGVLTKKFLHWQFFWASVFLLAFLYSYGDSNYIGFFVERIPLLNANRWWFVGVFYSTIAIIFLVAPKLIALRNKKKINKVDELQLFIVIIIAISFLVYFKASTFEYLLVSISGIVIFVLGRVTNRDQWEITLFILIVLNVLSIAFMPHFLKLDGRYLPSDGEGGYNQLIENRVKSVVITDNFRSIGKGDQYIYNDEKWLIEKLPFSHGFNPLGSPLYWYLKNEPFFSSFVVVTQKIRQETDLDREEFLSDNEFALAITSDVLVNMATPTIDSDNFRKIDAVENFEWKLKNLKVEPNVASMSVSVNSAAYLIFNNVNSSGWSAYIDGEKVNMVSSNHIFQGVFIDGTGTYEIVFKYRPKLTISLILLPYIVLMCSLLGFGFHLRQRVRNCQLTTY